MTIENLVVEYQRGNKDKFNEVYELMMNEFIKNSRYLKFYDINEHDRMSAYSLAIWKAIDSYDINNNVKFNSYFINICRNEYRSIYKYMKRSIRDNGTIDLEIDNYTESEYLKLEDNNIIDSKLEKSINLALSKIKSEIKNYVIPILTGELKQIEVADKLNISKQQLNNYLRKFKKDVQDLLITI